jgi:hypothetical protein
MKSTVDYRSIELPNVTSGSSPGGTETASHRRGPASRRPTTSERCSRSTATGRAAVLSRGADIDPGFQPARANLARTASWNRYGTIDLGSERKGH